MATKKAAKTATNAVTKQARAKTATAKPKLNAAKIETRQSKLYGRG